MDSLSHADVASIYNIVNPCSSRLCLCFYVAHLFGAANRRQDYGVSKLARALFKPKPQKTSEASLLVLQKVADSLKREYRALIHPGNLHEYYDEFHGAYGSQCHKYMKIRLYILKNNKVFWRTYKLLKVNLT